MKNHSYKRNQKIKKGGAMHEFSNYTSGDGGGAAASGALTFGQQGSQQQAMVGSNTIGLHPQTGGNPLGLGNNTLDSMKSLSLLPGVPGMKLGGKNKKRGGNSSNLAKIAVPALLTYATTMIAPRSRKTYKGYKGSRNRFNRSRKFSRRNR